ncbi:MAG TPA: hypothetical protein ENK62_08885 [Chromatiales bacterium]|nr:hypothetical protein [Chromatiales bacterium]
MEPRNQAVVTAIVRILKPLVRILLRHGISCPAVEELLRRAYVEVAQEEFAVPGRKQSTSRIAVLTGLSRKEVARLRKLPPVEQVELDERYNRAARIISGWLRDEDFLDRKGDPDILPFDGPRSFSELVRRYSGDMTPRAMADELLRVGAMETTPHGEFRLTARGYVPMAGDEEKLQVLGTDTRDLIETIDHNITRPPAQARFQRKVLYDNVPVEHVREFERLAARLGQNVLEQLDEWLARHDRDSTPGVQGTGRVRLGLGIYEIQAPAEASIHEDTSDATADS